MVPGYIFNLSENGVGIRCNRIFLPKTKISIQIYMGDADLGESTMSDIINLEGTVAWVSDLLPGIMPTMGIKFVSDISEIQPVYYQRISRGVPTH